MNMARIIYTAISGCFVSSFTYYLILNMGKHSIIVCCYTFLKVSHAYRYTLPIWATSSCKSRETSNFYP